MKYTKLILDERMIVPEPKIRLEFFLHAIVTGETCELKPKTVDEEYLYAIATSDTSRIGEIYPRTLVEIYYDAILNNSVEDLPTPRTRWEEFLRSAVTKEPCELEPETSLEIYLSQISSNGGFDYIVSTSTNSTIISLPNSTNGTIKSIEMDGNTLVNYCTNGSEELTLNNEINVQGTNVTLTDTVKYSKVDVVCEGNTLVNLITSNSNEVVTLEQGSEATILGQKYKCQNMKTNTSYTLVLQVDEYTGNKDVMWGLYFSFSPSNISIRNVELNNEVGIIKRVFSLLDEIHDDNSLYIKYHTDAGANTRVKFKNVMLLEGDYTNKPIPSYFEGMKSAFELEDNEVEILSHNGNYVNTENTKQSFPYSIMGVTFSKSNLTYNVQGSTNGYPYARVIEVGRLEPNTKYSFSCNISGVGAVGARIISRKFANNPTMFSNGSIFTTPSDVRDDWGIDIVCSPSENIDVTISEIMINKSDNKMSYKPYATNTHSIQLSEPLRGLPNGLCDKFVKQGGKWYVERNCGEVVLDSTEYWNNTTNDSTNGYRFSTDIINKSGINGGGLICDKLKAIERPIPGSSVDIGFELHCISISTYQAVLYVSTPYPREEFKQWLQQNPTKVVYQLATPTYEEITDPQIITYLDTTHISTNSTIPCNMQVKNSGYNAIIKPSTQYTVAFDTNTSGEVNIGLGGAKTSTTNNVATITTPSALTDDSLTLYGKGIKANNVRLLEGDKTNYIPKYFEGMKSCFEDKEQDNGNYEVEIISNNKNLLDIDYLENFDNYIKNNSVYSSIPIKLKPNTVYTFSFDEVGAPTTQIVLNIAYGIWEAPEKNYIITSLFNTSTPINSPKKITFNSGNHSTYYLQYYENSHTISNADISQWFTRICSNIQLEESNVKTDYTPHKSNSIQLQLNEPLRAVGDVKDRFVLKDGKLMIERNFGEIVLDGSVKYPEWHGSNTYIRKYSTSATGGFSTSCFCLGNIPNKINKWCSSLSNNFITQKNGQAFTSEIASHGMLSDHPDLPNIYLCIGNDNSLTLDDFYNHMSKNPTTIVYQLAEPTYEEVPTSQRLACYENATLCIDTNIIPTHVEIEYPTEKQQLFRIK